MNKAIVIVMILFILFDIFSENADVIKKSLEGKTYKQQAILLEKYILSDAKNIPLYILKAETEIKNLDYAKANTTLQSALKIDPDNIHILDLAGLSLFHLNKPDEAVKYFTRALEIDKTDRLALFYLSLADPLNNFGNTKTSEKRDVPGLKELIAKYGQTDDANCNYIFMLNKREVTIKDEKTMSYSIHCVVKILSAQGVNTFRNFQYAFNSYEISPQVIQAGSYNTDLVFNEVNDKNIVVVDSKGDNGGSVYTNRKYIAFPLPDLSIGSVVEYNIVFNATGKNLSTSVFDENVFGGYDRTGLAQYIVRYPSNLKVNIFKNSESISLAEKTSEGIKEKIFVYENPPVFDLKGETVTIFEVAPVVMLGTFKDWESISKWYSDIFERTIKQGLSSSDAGKIKIQGKTKFEKLNSIYQYVQKNIHYVAIELAESAMTPHAPSEIYKNKFGDCKDQVMLLVHLLRTNGIESYPVLICTNDNGVVEKSVPSPYYFNHVITYVPKQDGIESALFLDTTSSYTSIGCLPSLDQGATGLVIKKDGTGMFTTVPVISYENNVIDENYSLESNIAGGGNIGLSVVNKGAFAEVMRSILANRNENEIKDYFYNSNKKSFQNLSKDKISVKGIDSQSGDVTVSLNSVENSLANVFFDGKLKINFQIKEIGTLVRMPANPRYDLTQNFLFTYKKNVEYSFPEDYAITDGEIKSMRKENEYMTYEFSADKITDNHFKFSFVFTFKKRIVKKEDAAAVAAFVSDIEKKINFELTLENKKSFDEEKFYKELINVYPRKEIYENYVRKLLEMKKYDAVLEICKSGRSLFSDDVFFPVVESTVLTERGKYVEAESLLMDAMGMDKNNPTIYIYLSEVYRQSKNDEKFENILIEGNGKFNDNDLRQALILFYKRKGMYDKGIGFVKSLLEKEPDSSPYFGELGYFYSMKKDIPKAEEAFLKSIESNPKNSQSLNNLAWLYCENNMKIGDAISYSKKACELEPYSDTYLDTLAEAYYLNKSYDLAVDTIQKAININPNYTYLKQQLDKIEKAKKMMGEK